MDIAERETADSSNTDARDTSDGRDLVGPDGGPIRRVDLDLEAFVDARDPAASATRAFRADRETVFPDGPTSRSRPGDFVLENQHIRLFVEKYDEAISECSYGANPVDALSKGSDGNVSGDVLGEICPILNGGLTVEPVQFEILRDGSETGVAAVSATGILRKLDVLNLRTAAGDQFQGLIDQIPFDPAEVLPLTVTMYYLLEPGSTSVQMVTALRNDGSETVHALFGQLVRTGGTGAVFNPLNQRGGFGPDGFDEENLSGTPLPFISFTGENGSFAYVPEPDPRLSADLPIGGRQVTQAGVGIAFLGQSDIAEIFFADRDGFESAPGVLHLAPGATATRRNWIAVGDPGLSSVLDPAYRLLGVDRARVRGEVRARDGIPLESVRVTAISGDRAYNQDRTDDSGAFDMRVPPGTYRLRARKSRRRTTSSEVELRASGRSNIDLTLPNPAGLEVTAETPAGERVPARVSVSCVGPCPDRPTPRERDVSTDALPGGYAAIEPTDPDGTATLPLHPGTYRVSVTRGLEWSVWPADAPDNGGRLVELEAGETRSLRAEIAQVVQPQGAIGGDFHVHGVRSSDSLVGKRDRVMNFVSEGVDVLVSSDHDVVTDYSPTVEALGVGDEIVAVAGDEITTAELGHFNAFPLPFDPSHRAGGALDWSRGPELNMTPAEVFAWAHDHPGEQVVQINHAARETGGLISLMEADVLHGTTHADSEFLRLPGGQPDPETGDTGYWSDDFTALELMNGPSVGDFWPLARWWLTMIGRGFVPTGTATTDTHELFSDLGGTPRTYVFVGSDFDSPTSFDRGRFAERINDGRAVGTNGPYFRVDARNGDGERARLGSTLSSHEGTVTLEVRVDVPVWMDVDRVDVFSNAGVSISEPGKVDERPIEPTKSVPIEWRESDTSVVAQGERPHRHRAKTLEIPVAVENDAYVVVVVRADELDDTGLRPVVPDGGETPFGFSNPILVDADGGGYDDPPLADEAATPPDRAMMLETNAFDRGESGPSSLGTRQLEEMLNSFRDRSEHSGF